MDQQKAWRSVATLRVASQMLDEYRDLTERHGMADLALYEDLTYRASDGELAPDFGTPEEAMVHALQAGLNPYGGSMFSDESTMQFDSDQMYDFMLQHGLIQEQE